MLKECRLVIHNGTIAKCERLGIRKSATFHQGDVKHNYLIIDNRANEFVYTDCTYEYYISEENKHTEVKNEEFMLWPEPIKVGDWVKVSEDGITLIGVVSMVEFNIVQVKTGIKAVKTVGIGNCTKLIPNQIEVLNLNTKEGTNV